MLNALKGKLRHFLIILRKSNALEVQNQGIAYKALRIPVKDPCVCLIIQL